MIRLMAQLYFISIHYQTHSDFTENQKVVGSQSESDPKIPKTSSTNHNRVALRQKNTRELSVSVEDPSGLSAALGSL